MEEHGMSFVAFRKGLEGLGGFLGSPGGLCKRQQCLPPLGGLLSHQVAADALHDMLEVLARGCIPPEGRPFVVGVDILHQKHGKLPQIEAGVQRRAHLLVQDLLRNAAKFVVNDLRDVGKRCSHINK